MRLSVAGKPVTVSAKDAIGKGGEADVYDLHDGFALKVFKTEKDPDYANDPAAQEGARRRLVEQQDKLPAFPSGLPSSVVVPQELARNGTQKIVGYTMDYLQGCEVLLRYGDRRFREQGGISPNDVVNLFGALAEAVAELHSRRVVIGDFNDLNVLADPTQAQVHLIDADSFQYGKFACHTFTPRFLDPLISDPGRLEMIHTPGVLTDWYAYAVMLFQSLLYVGPYGGVYRPKTGPRLQHDQRVLKRITVFSPEVIYPKPAIPYGYLPDELLDYFHRVFEKDGRDRFDLGMLDVVEWTTCSNCGTVHARPVCPACSTYVKKEPVVVRGSVKARRVFVTEGRIVCAVYQPPAGTHVGGLRYLYHERESDRVETFRRENGHAVIRGPLKPGLRYRVAGEKSLIAARHRLLVFDEATSENVPRGNTIDVDTYGHLPVFDANSRAWYWVDQVGQLQKRGPRGQFNALLGNVLPGRTLFWTGEKFGFGFYRAGELTRAFAFDDRGLNDQVHLPDFRGELVDTTCTFSDQRAWFFATLQERGRLRNHVYVIAPDGKVLASETVEQTEDHWLASGIRGRFAVGLSLYVPTTDGIVRVDELDLTAPGRTFPDTEPFVDETSYLLAGDGGIYVVGTNEITLLTIT